MDSSHSEEEGEDIFKSEEEGEDVDIFYEDIKVMDFPVRIGVLKTCTVHEGTIRSFCFFKRRKLIVTCSLDKSVRILDCTTEEDGHLKILKSIKDHTEKITDIIRLNPSSFLTTGFDGNIFGYSVASTQPKFKKEFKFQHRIKKSIFRLLRLTNDLFLSQDLDGEIVLYTYSKNEIFRTLRTEKMEFYKILRLSKTFKFSFYVNTDDAIIKTTVLNPHYEDLVRRIKLINFKTNEILETFEEHDDAIYLICPFKKEENKEELLICGGNYSALYFYISSPYSKNNIKKIKNYNNDNNKKKKLIKIVSFRAPLYGSIILGNKYLVIGDDDGEIHLLQFEFTINNNENNNNNEKEEEELEVKYLRSEKNIHCDNVREFKIISKRVEKNYNKEVVIELASCAGESDKSCKIFSIRFRNGEEEIDNLFSRKEREVFDDFKQRKNFLFFEKEKYYYYTENENEEKKKKYEVNIFLGKKEIKIFKFLVV